MKRIHFDPGNPPPLTAEEREQLRRLEAMGDDEVDTTDVPELTEQELSDLGARRAGARLAREARAATGLSQAAFAGRYRLPLRTFQDWEQGQRLPDAAAQNYLRLITKLPEVVAKALTDAP